MKMTVYSIPIYFLCLFFYKSFAPAYDFSKISMVWVDCYWLITSVFYSIVFFELSYHLFIKKYAMIVKCVAVYNSIMAAFYLICLFNITLYARFAMSANKLTVGAVTIIMILLVSTVKAFKHDKDSERAVN